MLAGAAAPNPNSPRAVRHAADPDCRPSNSSSVNLDLSFGDIRSTNSLSRLSVRLRFVDSP